jgi:hypothetical protein
LITEDAYQAITASVTQSIDIHVVYSRERLEKKREKKERKNQKSKSVLKGYIKIPKASLVPLVLQGECVFTERGSGQRVYVIENDSADSCVPSMFGELGWCLSILRIRNFNNYARQSRFLMPELDHLLTSQMFDYCFSVPLLRLIEKENTRRSVAVDLE